ncbi:cache and HAMP domain-containing protein [Candidatus Parcubacteria bacterium]|nr:cache and HAMP domain-containing protein [Candidatus Parcubacteria bacterium]
MSLFKKIIASFLLVSVVPITAFGVFIVNKIFDIVREAALEESISSTRQIGWQIDTYFETILKSMESLASLPEMVDFDKERIDLLLDSYYANYTIYYDGLDTIFEASPFEAFTVLSDKGSVKTIYPLEEDYLGYDYFDQLFFQEVIQKKKTFFSSDISISESTGEPVIIIAVPVFDEQGEVSFIVKADIKLEGILQLTNQIKMEGTNSFFTINRKGIIVTHPEKELILQFQNIEEKMSAELLKQKYSHGVIFHPPENPDRIIVYSSLGTIDWIVVSNQSLPEVLAAPLSIRNQFLLLLLLIIISVILAAFSLSGKITTPLKKLTEKVSEIGVKQGTDTEIVVKTGDEIEKLATSFNQMLRRLNAKTTQLEIKTEELQERIRELNKWYKLTVGRELKMIELKEELKKMEEKLKNPFKK